METYIVTDTEMRLIDVRPDAQFAAAIQRFNQFVGECQTRDLVRRQMAVLKADLSLPKHFQAGAAAKYQEPASDFDGLDLSAVAFLVGLFAVEVWAVFRFARWVCF
jgi:hypothetical protein